jgi:hypothetical protein
VGWTKLNFDAGYTNEDKCWEAALRVDDGFVIASAWGRLPNCWQEVTAGLQALVPSVYAGPVQVESDC